MIEVNSRRHPSAALLYRRLLTGNDPARPRAARDRCPVVRSPLRDAGSACCDWPKRFVTPSIASQTSVQCNSATDRQHRNPMLKECVSDHGHERMTMEALPGSSLEMIMTNLPHISWVNCVVLAERQAAQEKPCHDKVIRSRSAFVKLPP
jgi:hypothetical protein